MTDDAPYYDEETYTKGLSREDTLEKQIRLIAYHFSKGLWDEFEYSLMILLPMLPKDVRTEFRPLKHDTSPDGIDQHYNQFQTIQEKIESDTNMIWKKRFIKTYE